MEKVSETAEMLFFFRSVNLMENATVKIFMARKY